ncbi:MAG: hypothetical protein KGZ63_08580, partial [Clostridiales bacterium]|nr:hypothetical protein [Clostridiales bacterium]
RQLRHAGATRQIIQEKKTGYRRFEAEDVHVIWQSDFQHTLYLPDPKNPKRNKKALLFAILDDYSRYIVQAQFYWDEKLPRLEDSLKKAILRHGLCERFYVDNASNCSRACQIIIFPVAREIFYENPHCQNIMAERSHP